MRLRRGRAVPAFSQSAKVFPIRSKLLHTASLCPRGRWEQAKPSPPRLARHVIEYTQSGAIIAAPGHGHHAHDLLVGKERGYVDRKTALWRAAGADTSRPTISRPIFSGTRVPAVDVSQLHQSAPGSAQSSAAETGGPSLLTQKFVSPAFENGMFDQPLIGTVERLSPRPSQTETQPEGALSRLAASGVFSHSSGA